MRHAPALMIFFLLAGCCRLLPSVESPRIQGEGTASSANEVPITVADSTAESPTEDTVKDSSASVASSGSSTLDDHEASVRLAIARSLPFIESEGVAWMRGEVPVQSGTGCVSCHHVNFAVWGLSEARRIGVEAPAGSLDDLTQEAVDFLARPDKPRSMSIGPMLLGLASAHPQLAKQLVDLQTSSGRWRARGQFPAQRRAVSESDAVATMWALTALPPGMLADSSVMDAAMEWLLAAPVGETHEWLAAKMLLADSLGRAEEVASTRAYFLDVQNEDGGWGWLPGEASNAFSTGQALYALSRIGDSPNAEAQRYLLVHQDDEGFWLVPSSVASSEPTAERDDIYRFWGTAWAAIGLARSLTS